MSDIPCEVLKSAHNENFYWKNGRNKMTTACIAYYLAARDYNYCKEIRAFKKRNNYGI